MVSRNEGDAKPLWGTVVSSVDAETGECTTMLTRPDGSTVPIGITCLQFQDKKGNPNMLIQVRGEIIEER